MSESVRESAKKPEASKEDRTSQTRKSNYSQPVNSSIDRILFLQRTIGNQAVGRLIKSGALQTKLKIDHPDIYEQEADRVAEQVMRMPAPVQRTCTKCEAGMQNQSLKTLQGSDNEVTPEIESDINSLIASGNPLLESSRAFFEPRFGHDFSRVRVHTDAKAAESARAVSAQAFTVGKDVVFGEGQYAPATLEGSSLLAHELVHVVQQESGMNGSSDIALEKVSNAQAAHVLKMKPESRVLKIQATCGIPCLQRQSAAGTSPTVYMCAKDLETSPIGRHAFFRIGSQESGNPTYELEPQDNRPLDMVAGSKYGTGCWQGFPMRDVPEDRDYFRIGDCEATAISLPCLQQEFAAYPIGQYCTFGPNSNTFVGHIARRCGLSDPDPPGWTPGINDDPPASMTFAPSPPTTLLGCDTEDGCVAVASETNPEGSVEVSPMPGLAEQVMRIPSSVQKKCLKCEDEICRQSEKKKEEEEMLLAKETSGSTLEVGSF